MNSTLLESSIVFLYCGNSQQTQSIEVHNEDVRGINRVYSLHRFDVHLSSILYPFGNCHVGGIIHTLGFDRAPFSLVNQVAQ